MFHQIIPLVHPLVGGASVVLSHTSIPKQIKQKKEEPKSMLKPIYKKQNLQGQSLFKLMVSGLNRSGKLIAIGQITLVTQRLGGRILVVQVGNGLNRGEKSFNLGQFTEYWVVSQKNGEIVKHIELKLRGEPNTGDTSLQFEDAE